MTQIAYLCSQYPAVSHTFINREIEQVEAAGVKVHPFSMRPGKVLDGGTDFEKSQLKDTWCIHQQSIFTKIMSPLLQFLGSPVGYLRGMFYAIALQKGHPRDSLWAIFHFLEAAMMVREMKKRGLNHVHVHFAGSEAAIALYAHKAFGIHYSFTLHGPDVFFKVESGHLAEKLKHAAFVVCISHFARGQALRLAGIQAWDKLPIVRCGVDPNRYAPVRRTESFEQRPFNIVCTGRLTPTKGQALLILSCAQLAKEGLNFQCTLIGGGDDYDTLQQMVKDHNLQDKVTLTGSLPQDGVLERLQKADLFVLPTFAEGVPVVLMEAMSMEIPCISTRVAGIAELIENNENGWLIHSGNPDALTQQLRTLINNPGPLDEAGKQARETVIQRYNIATNGRRIADIYKERLN